MKNYNKKRKQSVYLLCKIKNPIPQKQSQQLIYNSYISYTVLVQVIKNANQQ